MSPGFLLRVALSPHRELTSSEERHGIFHAVCRYESERVLRITRADCVGAVAANEISNPIIVTMHIISLSARLLSTCVVILSDPALTIKLIPGMLHYYSS